MPKSQSRTFRDLRQELKAAAAEQALVRVSRSIRRADKLDGFIVGLGKKWMLLAVLDPNINLNGYAAVRLVDVTKVIRRGGPDSFVGRALSMRGQWPPLDVDVNLDSTAELIRTAAEVGRLVTLHVEADASDVCYIGRPHRVTDRTVHLLEVTPEAQWEHRPSKWQLGRLSRVEFGGGYEEALALVAGTPPA